MLVFLVLWQGFGTLSGADELLDPVLGLRGRFPVEFELRIDVLRASLYYGEIPRDLARCGKNLR